MNPLTYEGLSPTSNRSTGGPDLQIRYEPVADGRDLWDLPYVDGEMVQRTPRRRQRLAWISALSLVTLIAALAIARAVRPVPTAPEMRVEITTPPTTDPVSLAIFRPTDKN